MAENKYKFSIVIPCLNEEDYIGRCLDSIAAQNYESDLIEIVIVDGNSTDRTHDIIKEYQSKNPNIKLYFNPEKKTPRSLNIGIQNSTGDVVVILGAHTRVHEDFVKYNNHYLHEKNVKVTGGTQENVGLSFVQSLIGQAMEMPFGMASAQYRWSKKEQFVDTVVYAAYKKELFDEIGYFEEKFTISEDAEINWRIRNAGYKIFYSPKIKTYYYPRSSIKKFIKQMFRYGILRVNVLKKHFNSLKLVHVIPPLFVLTLVSLGVGAIFSDVVLLLWLGILTGYFLINFGSIFLNLFPSKLRFLPVLPFLIFAMHFAWGLGYIIGLILPKSDKW